MSVRERRAAALGYRRGRDAAPRIRAKGRGAVAQRILELARQHGIPVRREPDLLTLLEPLDLGEEIPAQAYRAVAEILAFLYRLGREAPTGVTEAGPASDGARP